MNNLEKKSELRSKIMQLQEVMLAMPDHMTQADFKTEHYFSPGIYMREMTMPKGSVVIGKIHKTEHMCVVAKGSVSVVTEDGTKTYTAPCVVHSMPGAKRALHALEETVWINVHHNPTNEKDLEKIDEIFVVDTFEQFLEFTEKKQIEGEK